MFNKYVLFIVKKKLKKKKNIQSGFTVPSTKLILQIVKRRERRKREKGPRAPMGYLCTCRSFFLLFVLLFFEHLLVFFFCNNGKEGRSVDFNEFFFWCHQRKRKGRYRELLQKGNCETTGVVFILPFYYCFSNKRKLYDHIDIWKSAYINLVFNMLCFFLPQISLWTLFFN